jgi:hypothetical protein
MKGPTGSQRVAIAAAFIGQAALIAAALAAVKFDSQGHTALAAPASPATAAPVYSRDNAIRVTIDVAGTSITVGFPPVSPAGALVVAPDRSETVNVTIVNPGPGVSDAWLAIRGPKPADPASVVCRVSELPPGTIQFTFTLPAADVPAGGQPAIVMGATENNQQVESTIVGIVTSG